MPGEGSVFRRKSDGRWVAALSIGPRGSARKLTRYCPWDDNTRARARLLLAELRGDHLRAASSMTLGDWLRRFLDDYDVGASQHGNANSLVRLWIVPAIGAVSLRELRPDDVRAVLSGLRKRRSAQMARHAYNLLAVALDRAERDGLVQRNPVRLVDRPQVQRAERRPWSTAQVLRFLRASEHDRYHALYVTAAGTGLRQGELLGLAWSDIDLERGTAVVAHQLQRRDGQYIRVPPKGNRPPRAVPLPAFVVERIREHRAGQLAERLRAGQPTTDGHVFVTEHGRPVNGSVVTHRLQRIAEQAGLPRQSFHGLRRFHATLAAELGVHPNVEQAQLGHANISTTLGSYTYVTSDQARDAAERVDRALRGA